MRFWKTAKRLSASLLLLACLPAWAQPSRVVTLAPSLGELAADLLGDDIGRIVGVTEYTDYPPALEKVASIGPYHRFNIEKVVSLKPDLVLATMDGNAKDQVDRLSEMKLRVLVVKTETMEQVEQSMTEVANALGVRARGVQMATQFKTGVERIRARAKSRPKRRVLLQIGGNPLVVVGRKSFLHEALTTVGAENVYADASANYPKPSTEDVLKRNPDTLIVLALGRNLRPFVKMGEDWKQFKSLAAIKQKRLKVIQGDPILRPTLRLLEGLSMLEKAIYE